VQFFFIPVHVLALDDISAVLRYYVAYSGNFLPTSQDNLSVPTFPFLEFLTLEDGADRLSRNVGKELPLYAAQHPRTAQIPSTLRRKPEIARTCCRFRKIWSHFRL